MGYMHINNLYKDQDILMFKECYAMEKIHGTSAHIAYQDGKLRFFSGGCSHERFVELFDEDFLEEKLAPIVDVVIYGEAYGGKIQKMSNTYGKEIRFVAFDVKINDMWLSVPDAANFVKEVGLEFVDYVKVPTDVERLNFERDRPSVQAVRNGCGNDCVREGVVLRPLTELTKNNGSRIMSKHKGELFQETKKPREVSVEQLKVLDDAKEVAEEWVTPMRISHVMDKIPNATMSDMRLILTAMDEDIRREGEGEIEWSKAVEKAISRATVDGVKKYFQEQLIEN